MTIADRIATAMEAKRSMEHQLMDRTIDWLIRHNLEKAQEDWFILCDMVWFMQIVHRMVDMSAYPPRHFSNLLRPPFCFDDEEPITLLGFQLIHIGRTISEGPAFMLMPKTEEGMNDAKSRQFRVDTYGPSWTGMGSDGPTDRARHEPDGNGLVPG